MSAERTDVTVIGAGVIGLASAWYLLQSGRTVRVLDATAVGAGSSHGNCGTLTPSHAPPLAAPGVASRALAGMLRSDSPLLIRPRLDFALWRWLLRFAGRCNPADWERSARGRGALLNLSSRLIADLVTTQNLDCEYRDSGLTYACRDRRNLDALYRQSDFLRSIGIEVEHWDRERMLAEESALLPVIAGGLHFPGDSSLRPDRYVAELARIVREAGGTILEGHKVHRIQSTSAAVTLTLQRGEQLTSEQALVASGAWAPGLLAPLGLDAPIQPGKGYSITYTAQPMPLTRPLVLKEPSVCVSAWESGYRLGSTMEFAGYDTRLCRERLDALVRGAKAFLRSPEGPARVEEWYGWRPMTWDDLPLIGPLASHPRIHVAAGHGMLGVSMSAATGLLVSQLMNGEQPAIDPSPYRPQRF